MKRNVFGPLNVIYKVTVKKQEVNNNVNDIS